MTTLLRVELTRLRWRRAVLALGAASVLIPLVILIVISLQSGPHSGGYFSYNGSPPPSIDLHGELSGSLAGVGAVVGIFVMLTAITFAGHDWATGSLSNQLLVEPRRLRVFAAKAVVLAAVGFLVSALVQAAFWSALWALAVARDTGAGAGGRAAADGYEQLLRVAALTTLCAVGSFFLTMLLRSTVGTLGLLIGLSIAVPLIATQLSFVASHRVGPEYNLQAVVDNGATFVSYGEYDGRGQSGDTCRVASVVRITDYRQPAQCRVHVSQGEGWGYVGGILVLLGAASAWSFRRRDVP